MQKANAKKEQIYSDTVEEIISNEFPAFLRYGISIIFVLFIALFSLAWIIKYPDTIEAPLQIKNQEAVQDSFYAEMILPQKDFLKIKINQSVKIKLDAFPFQEFGMITGNVAQIINTLNDNSNLLIKISFNKSAIQKTTKIILKSGLNGTGEIIFADKRIIEKLLPSLHNVN